MHALHPVTAASLGPYVHDSVHKDQLLTHAVALVPCGHIFNESTALQLIQQRRSACSECRSSIESFVPIYNLRQIAWLIGSEQKEGEQFERRETEQAKKVAQLFDQATQLFTQKKYDLAATVYIEILKCSPQHATAQNLLDRCLNHSRMPLSDTSTSLKPQGLWRLLSYVVAWWNPAAERQRKVEEEQRKKNEDFHSAILHDEVEGALLHLSSGADINSRDARGRSALMTALERRLYPLVETLLQKGADVSAEDLEKKTVLMWAAQYGVPSARIVADMVAKGANMHAKDINEMTALMWGAKYGTADTVQALIGAGARLDDQDAKRKTALIHAVQSGTFPIGNAKVLVDRGADIALKDIEGNTALAYAQQKQNREVIALLQAPSVCVIM